MTIEENRGYRFYKSLNSPKLIVAPMVDHSDINFRELCRKYGAELCYTQMIHAKQFVDSIKIRNEYLYKCSFDRPIICQFCVNDVDVFLKAIELAKDYCDAIDINLGCPQGIARKGNYGAFLQDDWELISSLIKQATDKFDIPITCKIRVFKDEQRTIDYAKMIEKSGCYLLTVHGRIREAKGQFTGLADWNIIKKIKEQLTIPVFANGNIQSMNDVRDCLEFTGVDGVMSAEGLLYNPALFKSLHIPSWILIDEYLEICRRTKIISNVSMKAHLFKIAQFTLQLEQHKDLRIQLTRASKIEQFQAFSNGLRKKFEMTENQIVPMTPYSYPLPHYLSQAYFRPGFKSNLNSNKNDEQKTDKKHKLNDPSDSPTTNNGETNAESNRKRLKTESFKNIKEARKKKLPLCLNCQNPKSLSCDHYLCKSCCRHKCFAGELRNSCAAHRFNIRRSDSQSIEKVDLNCQRNASNIVLPEKTNQNEPAQFSGQMICR